MQSPQMPTLVVILSLWFGLIAFVLYADTLAKVLRKCAPGSRTMKPGKVWLLLIPVFGLIWHFVVVTNITKSLENEFARLGISRPDPDLGRTIGLASCLCSFFIFAPVPLLLGDLVKIVGFFLWIAYWNRIRNYSQELAVSQANTLASPVASDTSFAETPSQSGQGDSLEIARDRMKDQSTGVPYRWILPIAQLLICTAVLWPIRSEIEFEIRSTVGGYSGTKTLKRDPPYASPGTLDPNFVSPERDGLLNKRGQLLWTATMLDMPVMLAQVPYAILNPTKKTEWVPNGMNYKTWRAISWPYIGIIFWWIAGRGVEALLAARRSVIDPSISWVETGVGVLLLVGGVLIFIASLAGDSYNDGPGIFVSGSGALWAILGVAIVIARIAQWRIRVRLRNPLPPPDLLSA